MRRDRCGRCLSRFDTRSQVEYEGEQDVAADVGEWRPLSLRGDPGREARDLSAAGAAERDEAAEHEQRHRDPQENAGRDEAGRRELGAHDRAGYWRRPARAKADGTGLSKRTAAPVPGWMKPSVVACRHKRFTGSVLAW